MKKTILICTCILCSFVINAQITSSKLISTKTYENQTQTSYLVLSGYIQEDFKEDLTKQIENHPDIKKFSFYDNTNIMKCMFTSNLSINENQIVDLINDIISEYSLQKIVDKNSMVEKSNSLYVLKFNILDIKNESQKQQILNSLTNNELVFSVDINSDNVCKLVLKEEIEIEFIVNIFEDLGLRVSLIDKL